MKKAMFAAAALFAANVFAAQNDVLVTFSTPGPDKYADGRGVVDGECYALCWSKDFAKFAINSDGTAVNGKVAIAAPVAKGGRCPTVVFEIDAAKAKAEYAGGKWAVYLLDTRKFAADGTITLAGKGAVNTVGMVGEAFAASAGGIGDRSSDEAAVTSVVAGGVDVAKPEITGIRVVDGYVYVTVKGTVPFLAYGMNQGAVPGAVEQPVGEAAVGGVSQDEEITLIAPAEQGSAFFQVRRR